MKHRYLLWLAVALIGTQASAEPRKEAQARQIAEEFLAAKRVTATRAAAPLTLAATSETSPLKRGLGTAQPAWYAYNQGSEAFVIVSGDDRMADILGYSTEGAFRTGDMPTGLKALLDAYAAQAGHIRQTGEAPDGRRTFNLKQEDTSFPEAIAPLLGDINYNQGTPYNKFCPELNGEQMVTGCAATAAAMIMRYYKYPERGTGNYSYTTEPHQFPVEFDFGNTTFDWDNMLPDYNDGEYNEAQADAVATLMKVCGVASTMDYSTTSNSTGEDIMQGMVEYLGYDPSAYFAYRSFYSSEEWMTLIKMELSAKRPVQYNGQDAVNLGHAFVIDGYDSDDLMHVNWGWGGSSNGYFELHSLNPQTLGAGGGEGGGYAFLQRMIVHLMPRTDTPIPSCHLYITDAEYENGLFCMDGIINSGYAFNGEIIIMAEKDGTSQPFSASYKTENELPAQESIEHLTFSRFNTSALSPGTYRIYPAARQAGQEEWKEIRKSPSTTKEFYLKVFQDGSCKWHAYGHQTEVEITPIDKLYSGCNAKFKVEIRNKEKNYEFYNDIYALITDIETDEVLEYLPMGSFCLPALDDTTFTATRTLPAVEEGRYGIQAAILIGYGIHAISPLVEIDIEEADLAEGFNLTGGLDKASYEQGETMTYKGSIDIEGHSGDMYTDLFVIGIYPKELGDPLQYQILQVTATKEKPMHFELQFKATLQPGDYRFIVANHNGTEIAQTTYFEITEPSAIQGMAA
ncbi:C10 family peptidase [Paraprevotella clara]|uniref:C10 family peptidase n=1 Tax=Paraprevotella clara TaxID=454154 RepID=UPI003AB5180B